MSRGGARGWAESSYFIAGKESSVDPHRVLWQYNPDGTVGAVDISLAGTSIAGASVGVDRAGNVYLITQNVSFFKILKYNSAGTLVASVTTGGEYSKLSIDQSNNVYVKANRGVFTTDPTLFKFDSSLNLLWSVDVLGPLGRLEVGPSGDVYVCNGIGTTTVGVGGNIGRIDPSGSVVWQQWLGSAGRGASGGVAVDQDENVYVGTVRDASRNVWKLDENGSLLWTYDVVTLCTALAVDGVGGVYVASGPAGVITKLDYDGNLVWTYTTNSGTIAHIAADKSGQKIYATGSRVASIPATTWVLTGGGVLVRTHDNGSGSASESTKSLRTLRTSN